MKIYVDLVFLLNFIFDLVLLMSVNYILRRNVSFGRMVLGSIVGSITLLIIFIELSNSILLLFKLLVSVLMNIVSFGFKDVRYTWRNICYFYLVSMILGGGIEFLNNQFSYSNNGLVFNNTGLRISYGIVIFLGLFIFIKYMKAFRNLKNNYSNYYKCRIYDDERSVMLNAFLDTGNKLVEPYSKKSIVLVDYDKIKNFELDKPIFVPYSSLNNHGLLTCYKGLKLELNGKVFDKFFVGVSDEKFYIDGIDCILNCKVMEGLE